MPLKSSITTMSLPLTTHQHRENSIPQRPPHPLLLKAVDSQFHLLFKAWVHYAYSLPLRPQLGAREIYVQMDARVHIFGVITYEFNQLIAEFALGYGQDHPCMRESLTKDVTAYAKCTESDIEKLCCLWNEYSEAFKEKFREARRERLPKRQANLMKEELSRLLYVSKAMERAWLDGERLSLGTRKYSAKDEGIKRWIADTSSHFHNDEGVRPDTASMQKILAANKAASESFAEELRGKLQRRRHAILSNNYVELDCEKDLGPLGRRHMEEKPTRLLAQKAGSDLDTSTSPSSTTDSLCGGDGSRVSECSYDEFDINDMRYLTPMLFPRPPTPMMPALLRKPSMPKRPPTPVVSKAVIVLPPPDYPPPPLPTPPVVLGAKRSATTVPQITPLQYSDLSQTGDAVPQYTASQRSCSTGSSILATPNGDLGFSLKTLFSKPRSRTISKESREFAVEDKPSEPEGARLTQQRTLTPPPPALLKSIRKFQSVASLRVQHMPECPPAIPARNPNRAGNCNPDGVLAPNLGHSPRAYDHAGRRPSVTTNMYEPAVGRGPGRGAGNWTVPLPPAAPTLKPKGSMLFNGRVVKEVPKGQEDTFLELHAYRGEPF